MTITRSSSAFLLALVALAACAAQVDTSDRSCPCADGWVCCSDANVCAASLDACGSTKATDGGSLVDSSADDARPADPPAATRMLARAQSARCMASDETYVYWQNTDGQVVRAKSDDGQIETMTGGGQLAGGAPCALAVAGGVLYSASGILVLATDLESNGDGTFGKSSTQIAEGVHTPSALAADSSGLYVAEKGNTTNPPSGSVFVVALTPRHDRHYITTGIPSPSRLAVDSASVYWVTGDGAVQRAGKAGGNGTAQTLPVVDGAEVEAIATGNGGLFIGTARSIVRTDDAGGSPTTLATDSHGLYPSAMMTDGTMLWWSGPTSISKVAVGGGVPSVVAQETWASIVAFAANSRHVFWSNSKNEVWVAPR